MPGDTFRVVFFGSYPVVLGAATFLLDHFRNGINRCKHFKCWGCWCLVDWPNDGQNAGNLACARPRLCETTVCHAAFCI